MPTSDLPVEIWLEILAYLPRTTLHNMIGVNRTLFELALNDKYEEVRFIADDERMVKIFKQLQHAGIARRVRHLFIRPAFLPGINEKVNFELRSKYHRRVASSISSLKQLLATPKYAPKESPEILPESVYEILDAANKAVKRCGNLNEITVVVHDHALIPPFMSFLSSLWASDSIGPNLRKLTIDTTVTKIPPLLNPLLRYSRVLTNLEEFRLDLSISRHKHSSTEWLAAGQALVSFFNTFKGTLTTFSFSSMVMADLGEIFELLPRLPKLKKFEVLAIINLQSLPKPDGFTGFIAKHASTLETFIVKSHPRHVSFHQSDNQYTFWLNSTFSSRNKAAYSFRNLKLPGLRSLDVELRDMDSSLNEDANRDLDAPLLLPPLRQVAPNLTKLVLTGTPLALHRWIALLQTVSHCDETIALEELSFACSYLLPEHFDFLAKKIPLLKSLTIQYESVIGPPDRHWYPMSMITFNKGPSPLWRTFDTAMHARTYSTWRLGYLRLISPSSCGQGHPQVVDIKAVAGSLPDRVILDTGYTCHCVRAISTL